MRQLGLLTAGACAAGLLCALAAGTVTAAKVPLRYWIWDSNQLPAVKTMVGLFSQHYPNIEVKIDVVDFGSYWSKMLTVMAAGTPPDVCWVNMPTFSVWSRRKLLVDLQPYVNSDKEAVATAKAMWKPLIDAYTTNGHIYGLPRDYDTICVMYNEDAVAAAGLVAPMTIEKQWTWDTLAEYAKKLTLTQGETTKQWGFYATGSDQSCWLNFVYAAGGDVFKWNADGSDAFVLNSPESAKAFQWLSDKRWKQAVSPDMKSDGGADSMFTGGKVAMITQGDWPMVSYNKSIKKFRWNIAEMPFTPDTNKRASVIHGLADVILPASKHKKEAFAFVKFMASKEAQAVLGTTGTVIPSRTDTEGLFFSPKLSPSNRRAFERAVDYAKPYPMSRKVQYTYAVQTMDPWIQKIWAGRLSIQKALEGCASDMAAAIKRYSK